ncbi:MAG TPA: tetratricopeptide repeat protein [bacterium]|nr:tetratricopeptide repeat protein [Myxococcales bacterium]OQA61085.1 MAG: tetratricopeptide repeat protein [bacterium ADurb.Bin270]HPW44973.1 tetratricopeptide repeat protein [bacterium]HQG12750.1 tetratricopeptide repeat protein [bacterium]HQH80902.1 tetratricopeptide repeat protein [bacterium]
MNILNKEKILEQARIFIEEGRLDRAIREYEKIVAADPSDLRVKLRIAELFAKRKQVNDAIRIYREVSKSYEDEGFFLKAVTVSKNILRLNPSLIEVNEQLASLYERMGLIADAVRQYGILASAFESRGMGDRAVEIRARIVSLVPNDGAARTRLAETYQKEGRIDEAIDQYEEYARQLEHDGKDPQKLADLLEKILSHRPARYDMLKKLISIYRSLKNSKKALKWLEMVGELVDSDPELLKYMASLYVAQNQNETARKKLLILADLCKKRGDIEGMLHAITEILVIFPDEEERFSDLVDAVSPGGMPIIVARALARRKEIEDEEIGRQIREQHQKDGLSEAVSNSAPPDSEKGVNRSSTKSEKKVEAAGSLSTQFDSYSGSQGIGGLKDKSDENAETDKIYVAEVDAKPPDLVKKSKISIVDNLQQAEAAFDLGSAYKKMGLIDESNSEFKKASDIVKSIFAAGIIEGNLMERVNKLVGALGIKMPSTSKKAPVESDPKRQVAQVKKAVHRQSRREKDPSKGSAPKNLGRKKISFV